MIDIRPVSDLRNHYNEIEATVANGSPVYLTKNGYGSMVVMSIETYSRLTEDRGYIEKALDEADRAAETDKRRFTHDEVFGNKSDLLI